MDGTTGVDERARIKAKLKGLIAMTVENGCTEAEALAAAQKAADFMAEHDLTYTSVDEVKADRYGARRQDANCGIGRKTQHEVWMVAEEIGKLFNCKSWTRKRHDEVTCVYFGAEADTEAAHDTRRRLCLTMEAEFAAYLRSPECRRSREKPQSRRPRFMSGIAGRINAQLKAMRLTREAATRQVAQDTGRALVLLTKAEEVAARYAAYVAETGLRLRTDSRKATRRLGSAYAAGHAAGARVNLGGGARIATGTKLIGQAPEVR